jgi:hypothetical protein
MKNELSPSLPARETYEWPHLSDEIRGEMDKIMKALDAAPEIVKRVAGAKDAEEVSTVLRYIDASPHLQAAIGTYGDGWTHDEALEGLRYLRTRIEGSKPYWHKLYASTSVPPEEWDDPNE